MELIEKNPADIKKLFNKIAPFYDINNTVMSLGLHKIVKHRLVAELNIKIGEKILDACCGTGDISGIIKKTCPMSDVIGVDFSEEMLNIARKKYKNIEFREANMLELPFKSNNFDKVVMTFGLRNIRDYRKALVECRRVLISGGEFIHMDFGG